MKYGAPDGSKKYSRHVEEEEEVEEEEVEVEEEEEEDDENLCHLILFTTAV